MFYSLQFRMFPYKKMLIVKTELKYRQEQVANDDGQHKWQDRFF